MVESGVKYHKPIEYIYKYAWLDPSNLHWYIFMKKYSAKQIIFIWCFPLSTFTDVQHDIVEKRVFPKSRKSKKGGAYKASQYDYLLHTKDWV